MVRPFRAGEFNLFALKCVYLKNVVLDLNRETKNFILAEAFNFVRLTTYISVFLHVLLSWNQSLCMKSTIMITVYNRLTGLSEKPGKNRKATTTSTKSTKCT